MKIVLLSIFVILISNANASSIVANTLKNVCTSGGTSTVEFYYQPADGDLGAWNIGTCTEGNGVDIVRDTTSGKVEATYNPTTCGATGATHSLPSAFSNGFDDGNGGFNIVKEHRFNSVCNYAATQIVTFVFGHVGLTEEEGETPVDGEEHVVNAVGGADFRLRGFKNQDYQTDPIAENSGTLTSGTKIFMELYSATGTGNGDFRFAPSSCTFSDGTKTFTLFDHTANSCTNSAPIDFQISYVNEAWRFEYMLFLFDNSGSATYSLECTVNLCAGDAASGVCHDVGNSCLDDSATPFNDFIPPTTSPTPIEMCITYRKWHGSGDSVWNFHTASGSCAITIDHSKHGDNARFETCGCGSLAGATITGLTMGTNNNNGVALYDTYFSYADSAATSFVDGTIPDLNQSYTWMFSTIWLDGDSNRNFSWDEGNGNGGPCTGLGTNECTLTYTECPAGKVEPDGDEFKGCA